MKLALAVTKKLKFEISQKLNLLHLPQFLERPGEEVVRPASLVSNSEEGVYYSENSSYTFPKVEKNLSKNPNIFPKTSKSQTFLENH